MNSRPARVTIVGSYITALVMDTDRLPVEGETVVGRNFHTTFGGKGSNAAVSAARLGADAAFLGKVGRDSFARRRASGTRSGPARCGALFG
jgi:ribokinase